MELAADEIRIKVRGWMRQIEDYAKVDERAKNLVRLHTWMKLKRDIETDEDVVLTPEYLVLLAEMRQIERARLRREAEL